MYLFSLLKMHDTGVAVHTYNVLYFRVQNYWTGKSTVTYYRGSNVLADDVQARGVICCTYMSMSKYEIQ